MTDHNAPGKDLPGYELRLEGHLDDHWHDWVDDLTMTHETDGTTTFHIARLDQAALHGLLAHVRDLGATLISIAPLRLGGNADAQYQGPC